MESYKYGEENLTNLHRGLGVIILWKSLFIYFFKAWETAQGDKKEKKLRFRVKKRPRMFSVEASCVLNAIHVR